MSDNNMREWPVHSHDGGCAVVLDIDTGVFGVRWFKANGSVGAYINLLHCETKQLNEALGCALITYEQQKGALWKKPADDGGC